MLVIVAQILQLFLTYPLHLQFISSETSRKPIHLVLVATSSNLPRTLLPSIEVAHALKRKPLGLIATLQTPSWIHYYLGYF
jgi:hypothetical protein